MANHASALKRARQNERIRLRNKAVRTRLRSAIKTVRLALAAGQADPAEKALKDATSILDKAAAKGVIHPNKASRHKSRLSSQVLALKG